MQYEISWLTALADNDTHSMARDIAATVDEWAKATFAGIQSTNYKGPTDPAGLEEAQYRPIYLNDAMYDQHPLQSYGNNAYARLASIQKAVDPNGFFAGRTGGFKLDA